MLRPGLGVRSYVKICFLRIHLLEAYPRWRSTILSACNRALIPSQPPSGFAPGLGMSPELDPGPEANGLCAGAVTGGKVGAASPGPKG